MRKLLPTRVHAFKFIFDIAESFAIIVHHCMGKRMVSFFWQFLWGNAYLIAFVSPRNGFLWRIVPHKVCCNYYFYLKLFFLKCETLFEPIWGFQSSEWNVLFGFRNCAFSFISLPIFKGRVFLEQPFFYCVRRIIWWTQNTTIYLGNVSYITI